MNVYTSFSGTSTEGRRLASDVSRSLMPFRKPFWKPWPQVPQKPRREIRRSTMEAAVLRVLGGDMVAVFVFPSWAAYDSWLE